jgi:hypothetical protein
MPRGAYAEECTVCRRAASYDGGHHLLMAGTICWRAPQLMPAGTTCGRGAICRQGDLYAGGWHRSRRHRDADCLLQKSVCDCMLPMHMRGMIPVSRWVSKKSTPCGLSVDFFFF